MKYVLKDYPEIKDKVGSMDVEALLKCVICPNTVLNDVEESNFDAYLTKDTPIQMVVKLSAEKAKVSKTKKPQTEPKKDLQAAM